MKYLHCLAIILAGFLLTRAYGAESAHVVKVIPFEDVTPDGLLKNRAELSFRHLQEPYFQWDSISRVNFEPFPGDAIGRTINGLTLLSRALHQPAPANLQEIMRRVPTLANSDGYLGPKLPESRANEDTLAGHNGYACGLAEYVRWTKEPAATESLKRMAANLFGPVRDAIACYRDTSDAAAKVNWHLSGGDIGQLFLILDGMTRAYALVPTPELKATIETAIDRYHKLDLVGISAQTHAMLSASTGILRWYEMQHRPEDLAFAEALYKQYRNLAMTETYENYNWFNRPQWTEACAVSDSFILTVNLWRLTGRAGYLEDAHMILFNGLLPGQLRNGGFGTGPCVGPATGVCRTKTHSEAPFCCSMRGGEALARAIQYSYFQDKDTVVLPFYSNGKATLRFADGTCKVSQETGYPHKGQVRLELLESQVNREKKWLFFVPPWAIRNSFDITVNGKKVESCLANSFAEITVRPVAGTVMEITFQQERGPRPALQSHQAPGSRRYFSGPLLLGSATDKAVEPLVPILDILGPGGSGGEPYVYFPEAKPQPAANSAAARKTPNLAETAQVFRRDLPPDKLPREVAKLFDALKHDRNMAICGFVWSRPQKVRQVVIQWPESGAMPKPEEIVLRWADAGKFQTAAQPGVIGNGRQWVYTLGTALQDAEVDNLVITAKSAEGIPEAIAVPDVEILGNQSQLPRPDGKTVEIKEIKAYCLDFNWDKGFFAAPGTWAAADPAAHVAWYKAIGANVIQTFAVSWNGYAWYKNGFVPEQPGLKNDFLPEVVKLGHKEGMLVFGYFCISSNPKWAKDHPDQSYGMPADFDTRHHIPYTDEYLAYLSASISDVMKKTGIDGFMIDWLWQPSRRATKGKWLDCEKKLYTRLMDEEFPAEGKPSKDKQLAYNRKAIDRCWKAIRKAAKDANPNCLVWLSSNNINHPDVINSDMYKEIDWLMNEAGNMKGIEEVRAMVGKHTRLVTCLAGWNKQDATKVVPEALKAGVGLYGFTRPRNDVGLVPLERILATPVAELKDDDRSIAVLARVYHGVSLEAVWTDGKLVDPVK